MSAPATDKKVLVDVLAEYIAEELRSRLESRPTAVARLVVVGPPLGILESLAASVSSGDGLWTHNEVDASVLVIASAAEAGDGTFPHSSWGNLVHARNGKRSFVALCSPQAWSDFDLKGSIGTTTDVLGAPASTVDPRRITAVGAWPRIVEELARRLGTSVEAVGEVLRSILEEASRLRGSARDERPWQLVDAALSAGSSAVAWHKLGTPSMVQQASLDEVKSILGAVGRLAEAITADGFVAATEVLQANAANPDVVSAGMKLLDSWEVQAGLDAEATAAPHSTLAGLPAEAAAIDGQTFEAIVDAVNPKKSSGKDLGVHPVDAVVVPGSKLPILFGKEAAFRADKQCDGVRSTQPRSQLMLDSGLHRDPAPPTHHRAITYSFTSPHHTPAKYRSIILAEFKPGGVAVVEGAAQDELPKRSGDKFVQYVSVEDDSEKRAKVYVPAGALLAVTQHNEDGVVAEVLSRALDTPTDDISEYEVKWEPEPTTWLEFTVSHEGETRGWRLELDVEVETSTTAPASRLESFVRAHQKGGAVRPSKPTDSSPLALIEQAYLASADSWRPTSGCWGSATEVHDWIRGTDLEFGQAIGTVPGPVPWDVVEADSGYVAARNVIRSQLLDNSRQVIHAELERDDVLDPSDVDAYLRAYQDALVSDPASAVWYDVLAVHDVIVNKHAGKLDKVQVPAALLLGPLHPLRLAWHARTLRMLASSLDDRCPLVGFLDPSSIPRIMAVPIDAVNPGRWLTFLSGRSDDVGWSLLWSEDRIEGATSDADSEFGRTMSALGIGTAAVDTGFSESQTRRAIDDVAQILPARSVLRLGLHTDDPESRECVGGVMGWCEEHLAATSQAPWPTRIEVNDARDADGAVHPSNPRLSDLAERTNGRVSWYRDSIDRHSDLVLMDRLGTAQQPQLASVSDVEAESLVLGDGAFRLDMRYDDSVQGSLRVYEALSFGAERPPAVSSEFRSALSTLEGIARTEADKSHLLRTPNVGAVTERLNHATFVAATTDQFDPGAIVRTIADEQALLWDFELPRMLGLAESEVGYYLFSKFDESVRDGLLEACKLVVGPDTTGIDVDALLTDIAGRGIPVLKRMSGGGSHARGELGMLLALRALVRLHDDALGIGMGVWESDSLATTIVVPVDPFWSPFSQARERLLSKSRDEHPDLLFFRVCLKPTPSIRVVPVEVKYRDRQMSEADREAAINQAANLGDLLNSMWGSPATNHAWDTTARIMLAKCLDHGFRLHATGSFHGMAPKEWTQLHRQALEAVFDVPDLSSFVHVVAQGRLITFEAGSTTNFKASARKGQPVFDTLVVSREDAAVLLHGEGEVSDALRSAVDVLRLRGGDGETPASYEPAKPDLPPSPEAIQGAGGSGAMSESTVEAIDDEVPKPAASDAVTRHEERELSAKSPEAVPGKTATGTEWNNPFVSADVRDRVDEAFASFVGNEETVRDIKTRVLVGLVSPEGPRLSDNLLFHGRPSTGKTYLAKTMATALGLPLVHIDGKGLRKRETLFDLISEKLRESGLAASEIGRDMGRPVLEFPAHVILVDEVHLVAKPVQESLLTLLEPNDRRVVLDEYVASMPHTTFLLATTRLNEVDSALRTRCSEVYLREYTEDEVANMLERQFPSHPIVQHVHPVWTREAYQRLARYAQRIPRRAEALARDLQNAIIASPDPHQAVEQHLEQLRLNRGLDELGLGPEHRAYLQHLAKAGRPLGLDPIAAAIGMERQRATETIEPALQGLGFIELQSGGRALTGAGRDYLAGQFADGG